MPEVSPLENPFFWGLVVIVPALVTVIGVLWKSHREDGSQILEITKDLLPLLQSLEHRHAVAESNTTQQHERTRDKVHSEHVETRGGLK